MNEVDATRIEEFRQFKKEIRGSREYEVVGIDVGKEKHHAFFGTAMGKTLLRSLVVDNDLDEVLAHSSLTAFQTTGI